MTVLKGIWVILLILQILHDPVYIYIYIYIYVLLPPILLVYEVTLLSSAVGDPCERTTMLRIQSFDYGQCGLRFFSWWSFQKG